MEPSPTGSRAGRGAPRLWYDLSGLAVHSGNVTGITRAVSGVARALLSGATETPTHFCVWREKRGYFEVSPEAAAEVFASLGRGRREWPKLRRIAHRARKAIAGKPELVAPFEPGDVLLNLGFANLIGQQRAWIASELARRGAHYVGFVYDVLVLRRPEWWTPELQRIAGTFFELTARNASMILCCSDATRRDVLWFCERIGVAPPPIETVRLAGDLPVAAAGAAPATPPRARPYVLFVSTLDVRKNHRLLFQVWKRLIAAHGAERVPDLVFVGRKGDLVDDFLAELANARHLDGRIAVLHRVTDAELVRLYEDCLFTVYPSLFEGWGIPVTESLHFGKYCVASSAGSLPEVAGDLIDYHDPFDLRGAYALIERAIFDPAFREQREKDIRARAERYTWADCVRSLERALEPLLRRGAPS
jgi:glycosyltransferase involved in cell wall biosynthesis